MFYSYLTKGTHIDDVSIESIKGMLKLENCNFEVKANYEIYFELSIRKNEVYPILTKVEEEKIMNYFILVLITGILQILSSIWLLNRISKYQSNSNYV